jgi:MFS family permease
LLISLVPREAYGRASGVERAGDNAGAIVGPLLASLLVGLIGIRHVLFLALVPGLFAALAITVAAQEARSTLGNVTHRRSLSLRLRELWHADIARALTPAALFELGNVATTLLILRATDLLHADGRSLTAATSLAIVLYACHNGAATAAALAGGHLTDRLGPRVVFAAGSSVYVGSYLLFAVNEHAWTGLLIAFCLAGVGIGLAETAESTVVALLLPDRLRGSGFGALGLVQSLGDLGASIVVGVLWATTSATLAFCYAAAWMGASLLTSGLLRSSRSAAS